MISKAIEAAINRQINHEITAAYNYLDISAWFEDESLSGFAAWFLIQREEELQHAMRLYNYLLDRGGSITLEAIGKPSGEYDSMTAAFEAALAMEKANTAAINQLYKMAKDEDDYATLSHLQWFLDEQVEEEKTMNDSLAMVKLAGDDSTAILMLDEKFGSRTPEAPE